jgi:N12 class adenine-specific DNA methylase
MTGPFRPGQSGDPLAELERELGLATGEDPLAELEGELGIPPTFRAKPVLALPPGRDLPARLPAPSPAAMRPDATRRTPVLATSPAPMLPKREPDVAKNPPRSTVQVRPDATRVARPRVPLETRVRRGEFGDVDVPRGGGASWGGDGNQFTTGFGAGLKGQARADLGRSLKMVAEITGNPALMRRGMALEQKGEASAEARPALVPSYTDVNSIGDLLSYAAYQTGQGVASSLPSLAGGAIGGLVGGPGGALAGAFGPSFLQSTAQVAEELEQLGLDDPGKRTALAAALGLPIAMLDAIVPTDVAKQIIAKGGRRVLAKAAAKAIVTEGGKQGVREGSTEGIQEGIQLFGTHLATGTPIDDKTGRDRLVDAFAGGLLTGGTIGAGEGTLTHLPRLERKETERPEDRRGAVRPERIRAAAVRLGDNSVYEGPSHGAAVQAAWDAGRSPEEAQAILDEENEGFMTTRNRWLSRAEAAEFAKANGQYIDRTPTKRKEGEAEWLDAADVAMSPKLELPQETVDELHDLVREFDYYDARMDTDSAVHAEQALVERLGELNIDLSALTDPDDPNAYIGALLEILPPRTPRQTGGVDKNGWPFPREEALLERPGMMEVSHVDVLRDVVGHLDQIEVIREAIAGDYNPMTQGAWKNTKKDAAAKKEMIADLDRYTRHVAAVRDTYAGVFGFEGLAILDERVQQRMAELKAQPYQSAAELRAVKQELLSEHLQMQDNPALQTPKRAIAHVLDEIKEVNVAITQAENREKRQAAPAEDPLAAVEEEVEAAPTKQAAFESRAAASLVDALPEEKGIRAESGTPATEERDRIAGKREQLRDQLTREIPEFRKMTPEQQNEVMGGMAERQQRILLERQERQQAQDVAPAASPLQSVVTELQAAVDKLAGVADAESLGARPPEESRGERAGSPEGDAGSADAGRVPPGDREPRRGAVPRGRRPSDEAGGGGRDAPRGLRGTPAAPHGDREPGRGSGDARAPRAGGKRDRGGDARGRLSGADYHLTPDDAVGKGGPIEKARTNVAAIRTLKRILQDSRPATILEQRELVRYVGWGGIPQIFDTWAKGSESERALASELREVLSPEEYQKARASTLNAHYTSPTVINGIYDALNRLGLSKVGLIPEYTPVRFLEPSAGVGHFLGFTPDHLRPDVRWMAVELDTITGAIAKLLYPGADIRVQGFETARIPDESIDVVLGNVPFGDYGVHDPRYAELRGEWNIHNYFFAKALDKLRPGGLLALITSRYTMDARAANVRRYLADRADLIGAIRLPSTAFQENANTKVVTDLIILQKREKGAKPGGEPWVSLKEARLRPETGIDVNQYFVDHPEMVLGTMELGRGQYRNDELTVAPPADLDRALAAAVKQLPAGVYQAAPTPTRIDEPDAEPAPEHEKEGAFVVVNSVLKQVVDGKLVTVNKNVHHQRLERLAYLKAHARDLLRAELRDDAPAIAKHRKKLNEHYDAFVKAHGPINKEERSYTKKKGGGESVRIAYPNLKGFLEDPDWPRVAALEVYDAEHETASKADILTKRMLEPRRPVERVTDVADAIPVVIADAGRLDMERVADLAGLDVDDAEAELEKRGLIFEDPSTSALVTRDEYLSGNVRAKLLFAQDAAKTDPKFKAHVDALEKVIPEDLKPSQISAKLGAPWIPKEDLEQFIVELARQRSGAYVSYFALEAKWSVGADRWVADSPAWTTEYGTKRKGGLELLTDALNLRVPEVFDSLPDGKREKNVQETINAQEKQQKLKERFEKWVWEAPERATRLARLYNDKFNNIRLREYDGSHLTLPGAAGHIRGKPFALAPHQKNAIARIVQAGNTGLFHVVGAGKTYTMAGAIMEVKRLRLARKPMQIVPNHMLPQFSREFLEMYPTANLLVATPEDFAKERRKAFVARVASREWDAIVMTHRSFEAIPMSSAFQAQMLEREIALLIDAMTEVKRARGGADRTLVKDMENAKKKREKKLKKLLGEEKKDDLFTFEELGIDMLFVDEAHLFKNLEFFTKMQGISAPASERAYDLYLKSVYLEQVNPGRGLVFATGTPIANTVSEMFTMQRYLQPRALAERGLSHFDAWAGMFGENVAAMELAPDGSGYRMKTRFARFQNMGDLAQTFRTVADVKLARDLNLPKPPLKGGKADVVSAPTTVAMKRYVQNLVARAEKVRSRQVDPSVDNFLKITTDGRHAALDLRLVGQHPDSPQSKLSLAATRIHGIWQTSTPLKGTQLVFMDLSAPGSSSDKRGGVPGFSAYAELKRKLIALGIPAKDIAFIHDADTKPKLDQLFRAVRSGEKRILLGSTEKMGAGTNVQDRLVALHHIDAPWRPADIEQREGRILRQGNVLYNEGQIPSVEVVRYVTESSFDAYIWQGLERKAGFIGQAMTADASTRTIEDVDAVELSFAEIKAIASGNPKVREKAGVDADLARLERLRRSHRDEQFTIRQQLELLPKGIAGQEAGLTAIAADVERLVETRGDKFAIVIGGKTFAKRPEAQAALKTRAEAYFKKLAAAAGELVPAETIGQFAGLELQLVQVGTSIATLDLALAGERLYATEVDLTTTDKGLLATVEALPEHVKKRAESGLQQLEQSRKKLEETRELAGRPFEHEAKYAELLQRSDALAKELEEDGKKAAPAEDVDDHLDVAGIADPFTAAVLTITALRRIRQRRKADAKTIQPFADPAVEASYQAAKGIKSPTLRQKVTAALEELAQMRRHFPEVDVTASPMAAQVNEILLETEHVSAYATGRAHDQIAGVVKGLTEAEADLMTRALVLHDIEKDIEAGLYQDKPLPFGFVDQAQVVSERLAVTDAISKQKTRKVADAIAHRQAFAEALTRELVRRDLLPAEVLEDPRYYHRQVLEYYTATDPKRTKTSAGREVRQHTKGFQKSRVGGGDFNVRYHEAEFEWVAQAYTVLQMHDALRRIRQLTDITPRLKAEAKALNLKAYEKAIAGPGGVAPVPHPLERFAHRIGMATQGIYRLAKKGQLGAGTLTQFVDLLSALDQELQAYAALPRQARGTGRKPPFRFDHPDWWRFLSALLERNGPGAKEAATIFKAIREREAEIETTLGKKYLTWQDLVPEGFVEWQPEKGNHFRRAVTLAERSVEAIMQGGAAVVTPAELERVLVLGQRKETWVIPEWLGTTLDDFGPKLPHGADRLWTALVSGWKVWQLLSPLRILKYNFNNLSGDVDAALLYPKILKELPSASADLWRYMQRTKTGAALEPAMHELLRRRVIGQGMTIVEIPDLNSLPAFQRVVASDPSHFMALIAGYWRHARELTTWRENGLRLAAYRYFLAELRAGRETFGASNPKRVRALTSIEDKAALLARDLIGDYGNISSGGQFLRNRFFPFFSWTEVNAKRYYWLFRNVPLEASAGRFRRSRVVAALGVRGGLRATVAGVSTVVLANIFYALVTAWNHLIFPDEEEELRKMGRNLHLIVGRDDETGEVQSIRIEGAFSDFLEWVGLQDYPADVRDLITGEATAGDKFVEAGKAAIDKVVQMWEPFSKTAGELLVGRSLYPSAFRQRVIRDKGAYVANVFALRQLYERVTDKPVPPGGTGDLFLSMLIYQTDPGEAAYYGVRDLVGKWNEAHGRERGVPNPTARDNAVFYWRQALKWNELEKADYWLGEYLKRGGTLEGAAASVKRAAPLGGLPVADRERFRRALSGEQQQMLEIAEAWYDLGLGMAAGPSRERMGRVLPDVMMR